MGEMKCDYEENKYGQFQHNSEMLKEFVKSEIRAFINIKYN